MVEYDLTLEDDETIKHDYKWGVLYTVRPRAVLESCMGDSVYDTKAQAQKEADGVLSGKIVLKGLVGTGFSLSAVVSAFTMPIRGDT